ncbi:Lrp/AsnC family transcriptional regulator [Herbiconiux moechotypicola]|uniref:Lrp/AsnC family transcriptional regulator n=1 Tax=Herbiconiux moechotypicola TaxID=637393 RepID=A0ABP5QHS7_9MICO|nr:Lrp/AsnC family transcriptional regulator [Herbiconiux moechotypicola]MCS5730223.1 Lrp/AsnC family transcriptional regulator [Herbiconiux moechotypicola]
MDAIDRKILTELQQDARLTITELADRVNLSLSPAHRRLRELERSGVIAGYRAHLDAEALGLGFEALLFVTMREGGREVLNHFEAAVTDIPHVIHAQRLFGDPDYLLRVITRDLDAFQRLYDDSLSALPGVQRLTSTLVMKSIVDDRPLPL